MCGVIIIAAASSASRNVVALNSLIALFGAHLYRGIVKMLRS